MNLTNWNDVRNLANHAVVDASAGDNEIVPATAGKRVVVVSCVLTVDDETTLRFESGAGGTALTGEMKLYANTSGILNPEGGTSALVMHFNPMGWAATNAGESLSLEVSGGSAAGVLQYILE